MLTRLLTVSQRVGHEDTVVLRAGASYDPDRVTVREIAYDARLYFHNYATCKSNN